MLFESFLSSTALVTIAEIGDKTQLLSLFLAARFRRQALAIIGGIFVSTVANHFAAAWIGQWLAHFFTPDIMRWVVGLTFLGFAGWVLIPDKMDEIEESQASKYGAFLTTFILFFIAEMGDKTQLATVGLAAKYGADALGFVVMGTTLGILIANVPAVFLGEKLLKIIPLNYVRYTAALLFGIFGLITLFGKNFF